MDRISNLPDDIIRHIGSFLSAKEAAFTTVLSKRWHNLFTIIPDLHFDSSVEENFKDFVDGLVALPPSTRLRKFSLSWWSVDRTVYVNSCLRDVLKRGVLELDLWINNERYSNCCLRLTVNRTLSSLRLKKLTIKRAEWNLFHHSNYKSISHDSLITTKMFYVFREILPILENLSHLLVNFSYYCWLPLRMLIEKSPNLKTLTINGPLHYKNFYHRAVNTVCLCMSDYSFLLSCPLEVIKITEYNGYLEELIHMKHIVGKLSCLEYVEVHSHAKCERKLQILLDLQQLPRASSKCKFKVVS